MFIGRCRPGPRQSANDTREVVLCQFRGIISVTRALKLECRRERKRIGRHRHLPEAAASLVTPPVGVLAARHVLELVVR